MDLRSESAKDQKEVMAARVTMETKEKDILEEAELTLDEISAHPILKRVTQRIASNARTTSHTAHNSHYSSNT